MAAEPGTYSIRLPDGREFGPASMDLIVQWTHEGRVPRDAMLVGGDGSPPTPVLNDPALGPIIQSKSIGPMYPPVAPPTVSTGLPPPGNEPITALIPYRNPSALAAWYLGVFSWIPALGLVLVIPAIICGIIGLVKRHREPRVRGTTHAILGIIAAVTSHLFWLLVVAMIR